MFGTQKKYWGTILDNPGWITALYEYEAVLEKNSDTEHGLVFG
jgi:hypothetical protein